MIMKLMRMLPVLLLAVLLAGCSGDSTGAGDGEPDGVDLSGAWYGAGFYHTGDHGEPIHMEFTMALNLVHAGTLVQGSYTVVRPVRGTMTGSIAGTFNGTDVQLTFSPHGRAWGTFSGGVMSLTWVEGDSYGIGITGAVQLGRR